MPKRTKQIAFRVTEEEYNLVKKTVEERGTFLQNYIIDCIKKQPTFPLQDFQNLISEMKAQGRNFNQLVKIFNVIDKRIKPTDFENYNQLMEIAKTAKEILAEEKKTWQLLNAFLQKNR